MSWYVPQHSTASSSHHLPYLQFHDSSHVSLYLQTTKRLCCSSLDLSALPLFFFFNLKHSCLSLDQSANQSARQLVHSQAPHTGNVCPFTKLRKKRKKKKKKKQPGRNIQWREAKAVQQRRAECDSWVYLRSRGASVELRVRLTVVCGSCRTSERVRGREGGQQHCAVEMSHH